MASISPCFPGCPSNVHLFGVLHQRNSATAAAESELGAFLALERASRRATGWALGELEPATSIGAAVIRFKPAFEMLCGEFETMLAADHVNVEDTARKVSRTEIEAAVEACTVLGRIEPGAS